MISKQGILTKVSWDRTANTNCTDHRHRKKDISHARHGLF